MSNFVFVIDAQKRPLAPIHPGFARRLLKQKQAALYRKFPFTLILKESRPDLIRPDLKIKIDPGSRITGFAILNGAQVIWAAELTHRSQAIKDALLSRRQLLPGATKPTHSLSSTKVLESHTSSRLVSTQP